MFGRVPFEVVVEAEARQPGPAGGEREVLGVVRDGVLDDRDRAALDRDRVAAGVVALDAVGLVGRADGGRVRQRAAVGRVRDAADVDGLDRVGGQHPEVAVEDVGVRGRVDRAARDGRVDRPADAGRERVTQLGAGGRALADVRDARS